MSYSSAPNLNLLPVTATAVARDRNVSSEAADSDGNSMGKSLRILDSPRRNTAGGSALGWFIQESKTFGYASPAHEMQKGSLLRIPNEAELITFIHQHSQLVLIRYESELICSAASQPSTNAMEILILRGLQLHAVDPITQRGWHPAHCPFEAAIKYGRPNNLRALRASCPDASWEKLLNLPDVPDWAKAILKPLVPLKNSSYLAYCPSEEELITRIQGKTEEVMTQEESSLIAAAAAQPSTTALEILMNFRLAFHPYDQETNRGWHEEHCPFRAAMKNGRSANLEALLKFGAEPDAKLKIALREEIPDWAREIYKQTERKQ
jgi:hypothetical protein